MADGNASPEQAVSVSNLPRLVTAIVVATVAGAELAIRIEADHAPGPVGKIVRHLLRPYLEVRQFFFSNWIWVVPIALVSVILALLLARQGLLLWNNTIVARLAGVNLSANAYSFPKRSFDLPLALRETPTDKYFIGYDQRGKPAYLTEFDLDTHGHIMGHTGSGKTRSVLEPLMLQDMFKGKGLLFMDAKGSSENVTMMKALAGLADRHQQLKVFALAYPDWSQTYNPVYLGPTGDPLATAERVFSVFDMDNEYYRGQAKQFFYALIRLMAGTGLPFNLNDIRLCVADDEVLDHVFSLSDERAAKYEITKQLGQLGRKRLETFTGLYNVLAEYEHPLLNTYAPDIVIEDIMNQKGMVYFNLPANRYSLLAPAIGKIVLQHIKAVGSLRQIDRAKYDQTPFAVNIDELNRFAFDELVPSLAMLRDAHVQFRLAHQSIGDLEQVSEVFATQVRDNTRWKVFLFENDPDHLEKVARSFGTKTVFKKTVRFSLGPLFTFLNTGEVSNRETEEFILHPNHLKSLAPQGQGYLLLPDRMCGLNFEVLPRFGGADYPLQRKPMAVGLNLYEKFVQKNLPSGAQQEVSRSETPRSKGQQPRGLFGEAS